MKGDNQMNELIEALQILSKYTEDKYCFGAEHDEFYIWVKPDLVSDEDVRRLDDLGVSPYQEHCFVMHT
jgi:hypothetical protein